MPAAQVPTALPVRFIVTTFVVAAVVGGLILYFGLHGQLGTAIP